MPVTIEYIPEISEGTTDLGAVDLDQLLDAGEMVSGVTADEVVSGDLSITNVAASTGELKINGKRVAAGRAVQFLVSGQLAVAANPDGAGLYRIRVTATTDSAPARVLVFDIRMQAR